VHRQVVIEGLRIGVGDRARRRYRPSVADDAVDPPEAPKRRLDERSDVLLAAYVRRNELRTAAERGGDGLAGLAPAPRDHHVRALLCEADRAGMPDPARPTGDDRDFVFESLHGSTSRGLPV